MKPIPSNASPPPERKAPSPCSMLNISENATAEELKTAYKMELKRLSALVPATDGERMLLESKRAVLTDAYERRMCELQAGDPENVLPAAYARSRRTRASSKLYSFNIPFVLWASCCLGDCMADCCCSCFCKSYDESPCLGNCYFASIGSFLRTIDTVLVFICGIVALYYGVRNLSNKRRIAHIAQMERDANNASEQLVRQRDRLARLSVNIKPLLLYLYSERSGDAVADQEYANAMNIFLQKIAAAQREYEAFEVKRKALINGKYGQYVTNETLKHPTPPIQF